MSKRVDMINGVTGAVMSVPEELVDDYTRYGHRVAVSKATDTAANTAATRKRSKNAK